MVNNRKLLCYYLNIYKKGSVALTGLFIFQYQSLIMTDIISCPWCQTKCNPAGKEWDYGAFHAKSYYCKKCDKKFNAYYRDNKFSHTIPKMKK